MTAINKRLARVVDGLYRSTMSKRISWTFPEKKICSANLNGIEVTIRYSVNENHEPLYIVEIKNKDGEIADKFTDETITSITPPEDLAQVGNYFVLLRDLYAMAERRNSGSDETLDDLLDFLDGPDDAV